MKSIIVGGGKVGYFLLKTLHDKGYDVVLIERDEQACSRAAEDVDADIICGDGTDLDVLRDAGIEEAELIAAVTGTDEENLVVCQIAKTYFNIGKTIARVNNPKNMDMFKALGADKTVCSTAVIATLIENEFDREHYKIVQVLDRGSMILIESAINEESAWKDKFIRDLKLPEECVIASILRSGKVIYPRGNTQILEGDSILIITSRDALRELKKHLKGGGIKHA